MQSSPEYWLHLESLSKLIEPLLHKSFREALKLFNKFHGPIMYLYYKRDMANNMHVHIRDRIRVNFAPLPWAYVIDESSSAFMLLIVGHSLSIPVIVGIKFKKQAKGLRTANIQTQAVIDFDSQQAAYLKYLPHIQVALPNLNLKDKLTNPPKGCNLIAGYTPDVMHTTYDKLTITFPLGKGKIRLLSEFTHLNTEEMADIIEMPSQEQPKPTGRVRRRRNTGQPTRTKLRKFVSSYDTEEHKTVKQDLKKKKNERS